MVFSCLGNLECVFIGLEVEEEYLFWFLNVNGIYSVCFILLFYLFFMYSNWVLEYYCSLVNGIGYIIRG